MKIITLPYLNYFSKKKKGHSCTSLEKDDDNGKLYVRCFYEINQFVQWCYKTIETRLCTQQKVMAVGQSIYTPTLESS